MFLDLKQNLQGNQKGKHTFYSSLSFQGRKGEEFTRRGLQLCRLLGRCSLLMSPSQGAPDCFIRNLISFFHISDAAVGESAD